MSCAKYLPLISRFLDGEVSPEERSDLENHLAACASCRAAQDDWGAQGAVLRGYFARNRLDERFVQRVRSVSDQEARAVRAAPRHWLGKRVLRWAEAVAAVALIAFLVAQFFPSFEKTGVAKVIKAGDGLQVRSAEAENWTQTTAGAVLRAGDWIRNGKRSAAQILLNTAQVTLNMGTVAQLRRGTGEAAAGLTLFQGTVSSDEASGSELEVRTAAAALFASKAQFDVHVQNVVVPKLVMSDDASEVFSGAALPVAGVMVGTGKVRVQTAAGSRGVAAGETAYLTAAQVSVVAQRPAAPRVSASLESQPADSGRTGRLSGTLISTDAGLEMQVRAENVPLRTLLQSTTGERVSGAGDVRVTGDLAYSVEASDDAIVEAIGNQIGVPISVSQQQIGLKTATISQHRIRLVSELQPRSEFTVRKSGNGLVSFAFDGVPAGRVFNALQAVSADLPELSSQDDWIPVTLEASELTPHEVGPWLEKELGLVTTPSGSGVRVVQVGGQSSPLATAVAGVAAAIAPSTTPAVTVAPIGGNESAAATSVSASGRVNRSSSWWPVSRAAVAVPVSSAVGLPGPSTATRRGAAATGAASPATSTVTGKITARDRYTGSRHLIWPPLASVPASAAYVVTNPWGTRPVETVWKGYDASGQLVAIQKMTLDPSATIVVSPAQDLPACGENGHWETLSDYQVYGSTDTVSALPAVEAENLLDKWEFDLAQLGAERLWFANPTESEARIVLAIVRGDEIVTSQQITLGPHMALTWTADPQAGGAMLVANVLEGSLAAGVLPASDQAGWQRGTRGEWVH